MIAVLPLLFVVVRVLSAAANAVATVGTLKITTVGRDKFPGTEMPVAFAGVIAGEQGHLAAASRACSGDDIVLCLGCPSTPESAEGAQKRVGPERVRTPCHPW